MQFACSTAIRNPFTLSLFRNSPPFGCPPAVRTWRSDLRNAQCINKSILLCTVTPSHETKSDWTSGFTPVSNKKRKKKKTMTHDKTRWHFPAHRTPTRRESARTPNRAPTEMAAPGQSDASISWARRAHQGHHGRTPIQSSGRRRRRTGDSVLATRSTIHYETTYVGSKRGEYPHLSTLTFLFNLSFFR